MVAEMDEPVIPTPSWREQLRGGSFPLALTILLWLLVYRSPDFVWGDTWFNLVLGRQIAESGIIHRDMTTALGWGTPVVDVQWLAHLIFFHIANQVGVGGLVLLGAAWMVACVVLGGVLALRSGATPGRVLLSTLVAFTAFGSPLPLRAQTLVFPMLVVFPAVLRSDARRPSTRTWLLVPAAMVWANLHGSVLLAPIFSGALLVARVFDAWRSHRPVQRSLAVRDGALTLALAASIFVTPYGTEVWQYYTQTAGNPLFRQYVPEWWPLWSIPDVQKITLLVVIAASIARSWRRVDSYPLLILSGLSVMQVTSIRHTTPLALACFVLLPGLLDEALGPIFRMDFREFTTRLATRTLLVSLAGFVLGVPLGSRKIVATPGGDSLEARLAAEPVQHCMLVDEQQADRLMWYFPQLIGHLTHSVRMEAIPAWFMAHMGTVYATPRKPASRDFLRRYPIVAFDDRINGRVVEALKGDAHFERVGQAGSLHVFRNRRVRAMTTEACRSPA
jgi:hypothetical protein